jgi:hypothetical protein
LLNYPEVLQMMNEDLDWTYRLGDAMVQQQPDVIAAIEAFRDRAYAAGNLKSDEHQTVTEEDGVVEIEPADEEVIYVPYYEPERVVVYQPEPVYYYYPRPYPVYYYPYPYGYSFASGYFWGVTTAFHIAWFTDHLHVYHLSYWGHPYYGHHYFFDRWYYRRPSIHVHNTFYVNNTVHHPQHHERDGDFWRPRRHSGALLDRQGHREAYYSDGRRRRPDGGYRRRAGDGTARHVAGTGTRAAGFRRGRVSGEDTLRFRPRERSGTAGRVPDRDSGISFRARERTDSHVSPSRSSRRAAPVRRTYPSNDNATGERRVTRPSSRDAEPAPTLRRRPSARHSDATAVRRASPSSIEHARIVRRSVPSRAAAPSVSRPSMSRAAPPSVSRPSISRAAPPSHASRSATASPRSSSRASRAAPARHDARSSRSARSRGREH